MFFCANLSFSDFLFSFFSAWSFPKRLSFFERDEYIFNENVNLVKAFLVGDTIFVRLELHYLMENYIHQRHLPILKS